MRNKLYPFIVFIILPASCWAQTAHYPIQIPYASLGAYSRNFTNAFSFTCNQAILPSQKDVNAGLYAERRFGLEELNFYLFALSFPAVSGAIGMQMNYFGFAGYNESKLGIAYGKRLGKIVDIGIQFNYNLFHISGYGNTGIINEEVGILFHPDEKINIGLHVYDPFGGAFKKNIGERLASEYQFGIGYEASQQVCVHVEIIKEENKPVYVNTGLQYIFSKQFFAGMGIETSTAAPYGGAGLRWRNLRIDLTVSYHLQLGFTPGLAVFLESKNKKQE